MKNKKYLLLSTFLVLCGCNALEPVSSASSSEEPSFSSSSSSSSSSSEGIVFEDNVVFPELNTFRTNVYYRSPAHNMWGYQAKFVDETLFVYMYHNTSIYSSEIGESLNYATTHVEFTLFNEVLGEEGLDFALFPNGQTSFTDTDEVKTSLLVETSSNLIEYYYKVDFVDVFESASRIKFYCYDQQYSNTKFNSFDVTETKNGVMLHTHSGEGWFVDNKVGFKNERFYRTPDAYNSPVENWGYDISCEKEGIYVYAYQLVDEVVSEGNDDTKWTQQTHVELEIWQHNFGWGAVNGNFDVATYIALFANGSTYLNHDLNVKGTDLEVSISEVDGKSKIEYRYFINFDNNLDNPNDGPYAFIKIRYYDPIDNKMPYSNEDIVDYRDERFVHTNAGNSLSVHKNVDGIDDPFTTSYALSRLNRFNSMNMPGNGTLFIGDSYFESDNWWTNFYTDYAGKNAFTSAIGGTRITQWLNYSESLIAPYNPKNIVIHLGYNDIYGTQASASELANLLELLITNIHTDFPDAKLFYFNVESSPWFKVSNQISRVEDLNSLSKTFIDELDYCTYIDGNALSKDAQYEYNSSNGTWTSDEFFKDGTHPKNENYQLYMDLLEQNGCVIEAL